MIIDLGCGNAKRTDAIGLDNVLLPGVDVVHDLLDFPYPFDDESADEIHLSHVIEHFSLPDIGRILQEAYRLLKPGKMLYVRVPHVYSVAAWADPTHRMAFTFTSGTFLITGQIKPITKNLKVVGNWLLQYRASPFSTGSATA